MLRRLFAIALLLLAVSAAPLQADTAPATTETITLGGGCFWCLEAVFDELKGVTRVESGYAGGHVANPGYAQVESGGTGHAEVVQITFDPRVISRDVILRAFFTIHDPTTLNRQGNDVGEQYRSIAFYRDAAQRSAIEQAAADAAAHWNGKVVTQIAPFRQFYKAEDYHQAYFKLHGTQSYCQLVIAPKVAKFRKLFSDYLK